MTKLIRELPWWVKHFITGIVAIGVAFGALKTNAFAPTLSTEVVSRAEYLSSREETRRTLEHMQDILNEIQNTQAEMLRAIGRLEGAQ